jgi:hypothetical protein
LLLVAVIGTQALAILIAGLGLWMAPLGWTWIVTVWGYSAFWFLVEDRLKLVTYHVLQHRPASQAGATAGGGAGR